MTPVQAYRRARQFSPAPGTAWPASACPMPSGRPSAKRGEMSREHFWDVIGHRLECDGKALRPCVNPCLCVLPPLMARGGKAWTTGKKKRSTR